MNQRDQKSLLKDLQQTYAKPMWVLQAHRSLRRRMATTRTKSFFWVKRMLDILVSAILLLVLAPLFLTIALLVKRDGGPAFFCQTRIGKDGKPFKFWKFRSMVANAEQLRAALASQNEMHSGVTFKMVNDPRITPIGRILRRFSIDELPQLWNVFLGQMSLVGPRPPLPDEVSRYSSSDRQRLTATQGITCIWQVTGRNEIDFAEQVELDLEYISNPTLRKDLELLLKTIPAVITARGAR